MYDTFEDPYCYPNSTVLKNKLNLRDQQKLDAFEAEITALRSEEPLPAGRMSVSHYCAIHRHFFQDIFSWAGKFRRVRISKAGSTFCYPEHIAREMERLFTALKEEHFYQGATAPHFAAKTAHFLAELNAIHPFREGNGRTQLAFFALLAANAGFSINPDYIDPEQVLQAMITSFNGHEKPLESLLLQLISVS